MVSAHLWMQRDEMTTKKVIIDCDCGVDDAQAIMLALAQPNVQILAITCVAGNTNLDNVCVNVLKVLEQCQRTDIPVFKGASVPLLGAVGDKKEADHVHGDDGLGGAEGIKDPDLSLLKSEHAVDALTRLARQNLREATLVALGPLTNIALACRMDPAFASNLKEAVIMGGNIEAKGNHRGPCAEFNFFCDAESVHVVLDELRCPVSIVTWEVCLKHATEWEFYDSYIAQDTEKSRFVKKITATSSEFYRKGSVGCGTDYTCCDSLAMAVAVKPEIVKRATSVYATIEAHGKFTSGQMVIDWRGVLQKEPNVKIVDDVDIQEFKIMMMSSVC